MPKRPEVEVELDDSIMPLLIEQGLVADQMEVLSKRREALNQAIRDAVGDATVGTVNGVAVVKVPYRENTSVIRKEIERQHPGILSVEAGTLSVTPYRPVQNRHRSIDAKED